MPLPLLVLIGAYAICAARGDTGLAVEYSLKLTMWLLLIVAVERIAQTPEGQSLCFKAGYALALVSAPLIAVLIATNNYGSFVLRERRAGRGARPTRIGVPRVASDPVPAHRTPPPLATSSLARTRRDPCCRDHSVLRPDGSDRSDAHRRRVPLRRASPATATAFVVAAAFAVAAYLVQGRIADRLLDLSSLTSASGGSSQAGSGRVAIWTAVSDGTTHSTLSTIAGAGAGASNALTERATGAYRMRTTTFSSSSPRAGSSCS